MKIVKGQKGFCNTCQRNKSQNVVQSLAKNSTVGEFHVQCLTRLHALSEVYHNFNYSATSEDGCFNEIKELHEFYLGLNKATDSDLKIYEDFQKHLRENVGKNKLSRRIALTGFIDKIIKRYE